MFEPNEIEDGWIKVNKSRETTPTDVTTPTSTAAATPTPLVSKTTRNIHSVPSFQQYTYGSSGTPPVARADNTASDDNIYKVILNEYDLVQS